MLLLTFAGAVETTEPRTFTVSFAVEGTWCEATVVDTRDKREACELVRNAVMAAARQVQPDIPILLTDVPDERPTAQ